MWFTGHSAAEQCEGCTFFNGQVRELSHLHARDVPYVTFCEGPYEESIRYRDFMGVPLLRPQTQELDLPPPLGRLDTPAVVLVHP
jgi:predicted dithiol-disulfide oxidoreductase (DUF899 family)